MPLHLSRRNREASSLFEMHVAVRDGSGCPRHRRLSGEWLQTSLAACSSGCTHILGKAHHRFTRRVALVLLFVLTAVHPLLHQFEGGALDALLGMLTLRAMSND